MIIRDDGVLIRMPVSQIRSIGRATQGVKLIKLAEGTKVSAITRIISEEEKTTDEPKDSPESQES
jgi:DNA gyrase subunit A